MTRTRRVAVDGGFEQSGNRWYQDSGSFESFGDNGCVEFFLVYFDMELGGNGTVINAVTLWSAGLLSLGQATDEQLAFMASGQSPIPGVDGPGFPGEFFLFDYTEGEEHSSYSFGIGGVDYEQPYLNSQEIHTAFFTFNDSFQIIIDENGFSIIEENFSDGEGTNGYYIGGLAFQNDGGQIEFDQYPEFFTYTGTAGADTIVGTVYPELFLSGAGADSIDGGGEADQARYAVDVVSYASSPSGVSVNLATGGSGGDAAGDTFANIEGLIGSAFADTLIGDGSFNQIQGGAGADIMDGGAAPDLLSYSGSGSGVTVSLATGTGSGGDATGDTFANFEDVEGSAWNDVLEGSGVANFISGDLGNDVLIGLGGNDSLYGGDGDDFFIGGPGADLLSGGFGSDTASYAGSPSAITINIATGSASGGDAAGDYPAVENIIGSAFNDSLTGHFGTNRLDGGPGNDTMAGAEGDDFYFIDSGGDQVIEGSDAGYDTVFISISYTLGANVERAVAYDPASTSALSFTGNGLANELSANAGANVIDGGAGADFMRGLGGNDIYFVDEAGDQVVEAPGGGFDTVFVSASYTLGADLERVLAYDPSSTAALSFTGNALNNEISANAGANVIDGAAGADFMSGQGGNDIYFVDNAGDYVLETAGNGFDTVFATVSYTLTPEIERVFALNPAGTAALNFTGNALNNELGGTAGANILDGGAGADLMVGGDGNDIYFVDNAGDVVSDSPTGGFDTVFSSISFVLETRIERVVAADISATTALNFTGNAVANEITGNNGGNMIDGGGGADILFGNGGGDAFVFSSALGGGNIDALPDFQVGTDRVYLDDAVFAGLTPGALAAGAFRIGSAAADADDRIVYNSVTGALLYDADGNGAGAAVQFATLHEGLAISASEFQVI
jgi:Ca2+-binding RTX toxin-like protein